MWQLIWCVTRSLYCLTIRKGCGVDFWLANISINRHRLFLCGSKVCSWKLVVWFGWARDRGVAWSGSVLYQQQEGGQQEVCSSRVHSEASIPKGIRRVCRDELLGKSGQPPFLLYQGALILPEEGEWLQFFLQSLLKSDSLCWLSN